MSWESRKENQEHHRGKDKSCKHTQRKLTNCMSSSMCACL